MGNFFTSTQIYDNESLTKEQFIDKFCKKMGEEGYVTCDSDESELSYILRFADSCKWVTITSESYEQGNQTSQKDTGRIAKMLDTTCVNTVVIDSDCAILELYDKSGKKADTLAIGRADDYFGDDIPQPSEKIWKPFLSKDSSWEQFIEICSKDEVFVEDSLSELAPVIGMDSDNILFSADDAEEDENNIRLGFAKTAVKKEKKLSLNAAFKSVYGELLEPKGFKLLKSKYPYFVRIIDDEVIQIVSFMKEKAFDHEYEGFSICIGISLTNLPLINFDKNPMVIDNQAYMLPLSSFYQDYSKNFHTSNHLIKNFSFYYEKGNSYETKTIIKESYSKLMPFVFDIFHKCQTLEGIYQVGLKMLLGCFNDVVFLAHKVDEYLIEREIKLKEELVFLAETLYKNNPKALENAKIDAIEHYNRVNQWFVERKVGGAAYEEYMKQANETKNENLAFFKKYL